jgi:carbamoyl-phosphate synthase small subunit
VALADGTVFHGRGFGAVGQAVGELCFNTAMTGYQEIMTDPSYAGQVVTFTFPHVGNTGTTPEDDEAAEPVAAGMIVKWDPTEPSNWRATEHLTAWLARRGRIGIGATRARPTSPSRMTPRATSTPPRWSPAPAAFPASSASIWPGT